MIKIHTVGFYTVKNVLTLQKLFGSKFIQVKMYMVRSLHSSKFIRFKSIRFV
jgi:hypothetical protein